MADTGMSAISQPGPGTAQEPVLDHADPDAPGISWVSPVAGWGRSGGALLDDLAIPLP